jgi:hypothetical protein
MDCFYSKPRKILRGVLKIWLRLSSVPTDDNFVQGTKVVKRSIRTVGECSFF